MNRIKIILVVLVTYIGTSAADLDSLILSPGTKIKVDSIVIEGNDITEDFIILRELTFSQGDTLTEAIIRFNRERVYSLGLFNYVNMFPVDKDDEIHLYIVVQESWYFYPIPFVFFRGNNFTDATYGINFLYKNFRGRNETIRAVIGLGYDPFYSLLYYNPLIIESQNISLNFDFSYQNVSNKSQTARALYGGDFNYEFLISSMSIGKRFNQFNTLFANMVYQYVLAPTDTIQRLTASDEKIDRVFGAGLSYIYDSRDLIQFPENGLYFNASYLHKGFGLQNVSYNIAKVDFREYRTFLEKFSTKWRVTYRHTFGRRIPFYDNSFFGFDEFVRGHRTDERDGNNYILSSLELNYPIIKDWNVSLDLPLLPRRLTSARLAIYISAFGDTGITYNNGDQINLNNFDSGWGFGITILALPYNALRIEYAFDEFQKGELLIGTGFSF